MIVLKLLTKQTTNFAENILVQLNAYYEMYILDRKSYPIVWCCNHHNSFPAASNIARQFVSSPCSTVYSE